MTQAQQALKEGRPGRMMQLLRAQIPQLSDEEDLRGFEWFHLWRAHHGEQSRLRDCAKINWSNWPCVKTGFLS
jgi:hypothetical protein